MCFQSHSTKPVRIIAAALEVEGNRGDVTHCAPQCLTKSLESSTLWSNIIKGRASLTKHFWHDGSSKNAATSYSVTEPVNARQRLRPCFFLTEWRAGQGLTRNTVWHFRDEKGAIHRGRSTLMNWCVILTLSHQLILVTCLNWCQHPLCASITWFLI